MGRWKKRDCVSECVVKVIVVGDSRSGKSSIVQQFVESYFEPSFMTTISMDFRMKKLHIDNTIVKVCIWDTVGQERFRTLSRSYFRDAKGVLLVYDITDRASFKHLQMWLNEVKQNSDDVVALAVIGNKTDQEESRVVSFEEGAAFARAAACSFFETSAKEGTNVKEAFSFLAKQCKDRFLIDQRAERQKSITLRVDSTRKKCASCMK